jgi:hypothetical protein
MPGMDPNMPGMDMGDDGPTNAFCKGSGSVMFNGFTFMKDVRVCVGDLRGKCECARMCACVCVCDYVSVYSQSGLTLHFAYTPPINHSLTHS